MNDRDQLRVKGRLLTFVGTLAGILCAIGVGELAPTASPLGEARAAACAPAPDYLATAPAAAGGIGGTGRSDAHSDGGIGGTGRSAMSGEGGFGGTGRSETGGDGGFGGTGRYAARSGDGGFGGTGHSAASGEGGFGGTGHSTSGGDGGFGGTGRSASGGDGGFGGTGIVGTITGFASVCVNGVEVHYDESVPVSENGKPSSIRALAVGQVVALQAEPGVRGLTARRIEVVHALEGPVTRSEKGRFEVMGAQVVAAAPSLARSIIDAKAGDWVQVAGHRDEAGRWVATRVARIEPRSEVTVQGGVDGADRIAGVRVAAAAGLASANPGETRLVRGQWQSEATGTGQLRIRESVATPVSELLARSGRLIVETRVREARDGRVRTGLPEIDALLVGQPVRAGDLVRLRAHRSADGRIAAERLERSAASGRQESRDGRDGGRKDGKEHDDGKERDRDRGDRDAERDRKDADRDRDDAERADRSGKSERSDQAERSEKSDRAEKSERSEKSERTEKSERVEKTEPRPEKTEQRPEKTEQRPEKAERTEKAERNKAERVDRRGRD